MRRRASLEGSPTVAGQDQAEFDQAEYDQANAVLGEPPKDAPSDVHSRMATLLMNGRLGVSDTFARSLVPALDADMVYTVPDHLHGSRSPEI